MFVVAGPLSFIPTGIPPTPPPPPIPPSPLPCLVCDRCLTVARDGVSRGLFVAFSGSDRLKGARGLWNGGWPDLPSPTSQPTLLLSLSLSLPLSLARSYAFNSLTHACIQHARTYAQHCIHGKQGVEEYIYKISYRRRRKTTSSSVLCSLIMRGGCKSIALCRRQGLSPDVVIDYFPQNLLVSLSVLHLLRQRSMRLSVSNPCSCLALLVLMVG